MRPQTIRRLLVFAVCCAGVAALYFVPGTAESPNQVTSGPGTQPEPSTRTVTEQPEPTPTPEPSPTATPTPTATVTVTPSPSASRSARPEPTDSSTPPGDDESDPPSPEPTPTATATDEPEEPEPDPTDEPESEPPSQVEGVEKVDEKTTHDELTVSWNPATDDEDIKNYVIYLNGIETEAEHPDSPTEGTISWFNHDEGFFVQVAAVDTDDQEGKKSDRVTVERPAEPSPSPEPPPESQPPSFAPSATSEPSPTPNSEPTR